MEHEHKEVKKQPVLNLQLCFRILVDQLNSKYIVSHWTAIYCHVQVTNFDRILHKIGSMHMQV